MGFLPLIEKLLFAESVDQSYGSAVVRLGRGAGEETRLLVISLDQSDRPMFPEFPIQSAPSHPYGAEIRNAKGSEHDLIEMVSVISSSEQNMCERSYFVRMAERVELRPHQKAVDVCTCVCLVYAAA